MGCIETEISREVSFRGRGLDGNWQEGRSAVETSVRKGRCFDGWRKSRARASGSGEIWLSNFQSVQGRRTGHKLERRGEMAGARQLAPPFLRVDSRHEPSPKWFGAAAIRRKNWPTPPKFLESWLAHPANQHPTLIGRSLSELALRKKKVHQALTRRIKATDMDLG